MVAEQKIVLEELGWLIDVLPRRVADTLRHREDLEELLEVVLDLGRVRRRPGSPPAIYRWTTRK